MKIPPLSHAAFALLCLSTIQAHAEDKFPVVPLTAGMYVIQAEVAATEPQRQQGLMFREKLDDSGKILNIEEMQPQTLNSHCAAGRAAYALEMNKGWFAQKNIKSGTTIAGLPKAK